MTSTALHSGGRRWWFICPVMGTRLGKLYLPAGATHFAGRQAHNLTYNSCQKSGRDIRFFAKNGEAPWAEGLPLNKSEYRPSDLRPTLRNPACNLWVRANQEDDRKFCCDPVAVGPAFGIPNDPDKEFQCNQLHWNCHN
jgi:hypothetical protein